LLFIPSSTLPVGRATPVRQESSPITSARADYRKLPLQFEENVGQAPSDVAFVARGRGYALALDPSGAALSVGGAAVRARFVGSNGSARISGAGGTRGAVSYFTGKDPASWKTAIATYPRVLYEAVYPGIDLIFHGGQGQLEFDFVVHPGADPGGIRLAIDGATNARVGDGGDLLLDVGGDKLTFARPVIYEERDGLRRKVEGGYRIADGEVGFTVGAHDRRSRLVIDPVISFSTFLGGTAGEQASGVAVDSAGNVYVAGLTGSTNFPTAGALQPSQAGGTDAFVTKLTSGGALVYSTYLGGTGDDLGIGIAVDAAGSAYVTGRTSSSDFPTTAGVFQPTFGGGLDAFIAKLSPSGTTLAYSSYLGGEGLEFGFNEGNGISVAVDATGDAYVSGTTSSPNFPTTPGAFQTTAGGVDAFVTKVNPAGSALLYSTYLGGPGLELGIALAIGGDGSAYVAGRGSTGFPSVNPLPPSGDGDDAFIAKLNPSGSALAYASLFGGGGTDQANGIAVDGAGNAYVVGMTGVVRFPLVHPFQPTGFGTEAFVAKIAPAGSSFVYSSFLGGSGFDDARAVAVDSGGSAYVTGFTTSSDFPVVDPLQSSNGGIPDAFLTVVNPVGSALIHSTYLGGVGSEMGRAIAVDGGTVIVVGSTSSTNFPTVNAVQPTYGGGGDAFVVRITFGADLSVTKVDSPDPVLVGGTLTYELTVANASSQAAANVHLLDQVPAALAFNSATPSQGSCNFTPATRNLDCSLGTVGAGLTASVTVLFTVGAAGEIVNTASITSDTPDPDAANNTATARTQAVASNADLALTKSDAPDPVLNGGALTYSIVATNHGPGAAAAVVVSDDLPASTTFASVSASAGVTCNAPAVGTTGTLTCSASTLAAAGTIAITLVVSVDSAARDGSVVTNSAMVSSSTTDPDSSNNAASVTTLVSNPPPVISDVSADPRSLWPPDHRLSDVVVSYNVVDSPPPTCVLDVTSNEPVDGVDDGNTAPDWVILDAHRLQLRAERSGTGTGRTYTITITCTDTAGGVSSATATVTVPLSPMQ
jgi:uncharacterized repeat protein (TIGR01451 family)